MTARPAEFQQVTVRWLEHHGANYNELVFTESKYSEFVSLGGDVLVDDAPHYAEEFSRNGKRVIVFSQRYNRHVHSDYIYRAANWQEVEGHVAALSHG